MVPNTCSTTMGGQHTQDEINARFLELSPFTYLLLHLFSKYSPLPVVGARNPEVMKFLPPWGLDSMVNQRNKIHLHPCPGLGNLALFLSTAKTQEELTCFSLGSTSPV